MLLAQWSTGTETAGDEGLTYTGADFVPSLSGLQQGESVRVIVELAVPFQPEGTLPGQSERGAQRRRIAQAQNALRQRVPGNAVKQFEGIPFIAMEVDEATMDALRRDPNVKNVVEDQRRSLFLRETVPLIGADGAWKQGFSGMGQTIAVLDTGVDRAHPFFAGKVVAEACYSTTNPVDGTTSVCPGGAPSAVGPGAGTKCPMTLAGCDHGTHVAGIAAGQQIPVNGGTIAGVAKDAKLIAIQVFSQYGNSVTAYDSDIVLGLNHVFALRADSSIGNIAAVNLSLGGGRYTSAAACDADPYNGALKTAIDQLRSVGVATIAAAGNAGYIDSLSSPACLSSAISVGSTTESDLISSFSNSASFLSLLAPGQVVTSAVPGGAFANMSGTSMAAPHVAGAWAVLKSKAPAATIEQVLGALQSTGKAITDSRNGITDARIQLNAALESPLVAPAKATATPAPSPTVIPTPTPTPLPVAPAPPTPTPTPPIVGGAESPRKPGQVYMPLVVR